jgi:2-oxoglutarate ferredoxin oxidoreductase subunit delta
MKAAVTVNQNRCKGCELCIHACPFNLLHMKLGAINSLGFPFIEPPAPPSDTATPSCAGCANCAEVCPDAALQVFRKRDTPTTTL